MKNNKFNNKFVMKLLLILLVLILYQSLYLNKYPKKYRKYLLYTYLLLTLIISIIIVVILLRKEKFTNNLKNTSVSKIDKLKNKCGIPLNNSETGHCFADGTHQTCCMLGPEARKYAESSNNPIGKASERIYKIKTGKDADDNTTTPWCTCFGSKVCSIYSKMFNDGTKLKFVNNPNSPNEIRENVSPKCEEYFRKKFSIISHGTPGIKNIKGNNSGAEFCEKTKPTLI